MHKFDVNKLKKLDDPERLNLFDPEKLLKDFGIRQGMKVLDVGTGAGFYLPYLSKAVGEKGYVYAIDIQPLAVEYAKNKVSQLGLSNVEVLLSVENGIPLDDNTVDFVFMAFVFHELENPLEFLKELERVSKPFGYLCIVDWKKEERDKGPPPEEVYSEWEIGLILEDAQIRVGRMVEIGKYCFGVYAMFPDRNLESKFNSPIKIPPGL